MRILTAGIWLSLALPGIAIAQQAPPLAAPDSLVPRQLTPITLDEPGNLSPPPAVPARPPGVSGHRVQAPVNFRLASVAEAVARPAKTSLRLAPRTQASRTSAATQAKSVPISPGDALGTVAGSLGAVLGLFLIIVWCTRQFAPASASLLPKEAIELLGRAPLAARQHMQLVRIGNKLLLVALSPGGVETLTEISEPTEVEHLLAVCRRGQPGSSSAAFRQALTQLAAEPAERGFVGASRGSVRGAR